MKNIIPNIKIKAIPLLLLATVGLICANKVFYKHTHVLADGRIVSHSHPYDKKEDSGPFKKHSHSDFEFIIYEKLKILFFVASVILALLTLLNTECKPRNSHSVYIRHLLFLRYGRAPPLFLVQ